VTATYYVVKAMTITIGAGTTAATSHECEISGVVENETHAEVTGVVACADGSFSDVGPSTYTLTIGYNVSHRPGSLHRLLRDHVGQTGTVVIEPDPVNDPGRLLTYAVTIVPGGANMTVGAVANSSVTLPVAGVPAYTDPVVVPPTT
jgi:hypothetical protein